VYSTEIGERPLMGVTCWFDENAERKSESGAEFGSNAGFPGLASFSDLNDFLPFNYVFSVYTDFEYFEIVQNKIVKHEKHGLGAIPIIEYPANDSRLGSFEPVITILDAINNIESNRIDSVEQNVQAIMKFINCDIDREHYDEMIAKGAVLIKSVDGQKADLDIVSNELNQTQIQSFVDSLYQTVLTICGIPNRNGGLSTSDTGQAVLLRDGWSLAESQAKSSELMFKASEREFLKIVLKICKDSGVLNLDIKKIEQKFTRRNYENIQIDNSPCLKAGDSWFDEDCRHPVLCPLSKREFPCVPRYLRLATPTDAILRLRCSLRR
jgi:hypothetical protein